MLDHYNPVPPVEVDTDYSGDVSEAVWAYIRAGRRTDAIYQYAAETGMLVRRAATFVDEVLDIINDPIPDVGNRRRV
jgi:hypothetical protein